MLGIFFDADGTLWSHPKSEERYVDESLFELFLYLNSNGIDYFIISGTTNELISKRLKEHGINCIDAPRVIALADGGIGKKAKIKELILQKKFDKSIWVFDKLKDYKRVEDLERVKSFMIQREHNVEDVSKAKEVNEINIVSSLKDILNFIKEKEI
jgi:hydroxymethylpyrimidine pyrophosphatase-like HAD family hydrolase